MFLFQAKESVNQHVMCRIQYRKKVNVSAVAVRFKVFRQLAKW